MLLTERQVSINPNRGDFTSLRSGVASFLGEDETPVRFAVTNSDDSAYRCEISVIVGEHPHSVSPLFEFRRRTHESQEQFNVVFIVPHPRRFYWAI